MTRQKAVSVAQSLRSRGEPLGQGRGSNITSRQWRQDLGELEAETERNQTHAHMRAHTHIQRGGHLVKEQEMRVRSSVDRGVLQAEKKMCKSEVGKQPQRRKEGKPQ